MPDPTEQPEQPTPLAEELPDFDLDPTPLPEPERGYQRESRRALLTNEPQVEGALRQFNLERVRGDKQAAERTLRDALAQHPASGALLEAYGDLQAERGDARGALTYYRRAQSCGAAPGIEGKIARIALKQDSISASLTETIVERGTGPIPLIASICVPGLGLALVGETKAAAITFGGSLIASALTLSVRPLSNVYLAMRGHAVASHGATFFFIVLWLISLAFWIYSIYATAQAVKPADKDGQYD